MEDTRSAMLRFYEKGEPVPCPMEYFEVLRECGIRLAQAFPDVIESNEKIRFVFEFRGLGDFRAYTISGDNKGVE